MPSLSSDTVPFQGTFDRPVDRDGMFRLMTALAATRCMYPQLPFCRTPVYAEPSPPPPSGTAANRLCGLLKASEVDAFIAAGRPGERFTEGPVVPYGAPVWSLAEHASAGNVPALEGQIRHRCKYRVWWRLFNRLVELVASGAPPKRGQAIFLSWEYSPSFSELGGPPDGFEYYAYGSTAYGPSPPVLDSSGGAAAVPWTEMGVLTDGWISPETYDVPLGEVKCCCNTYGTQAPEPDPEDPYPPAVDGITTEERNAPVLPTMADEDLTTFLGYSGGTANRHFVRNRWRELCSSIGLDSWIPDAEHYSPYGPVPYRQAMEGGGSYAPRWRGDSEPMYWRYRYPYCLKQRESEWTGAASGWDCDFPYHGLCALGSVLEHVEDRAVGYMAGAELVCPRSSDAYGSGNDLDTCVSRAASNGYSRHRTVRLHYTATMSRQTSGNGETSVHGTAYPDEASTPTLKLELTAVDRIRSSSQFAHETNSIRLSDSRSESVSVGYTDLTDERPYMEFVVPSCIHRVVDDPDAGQVDEYDLSGYDGSQHSAEENLGYALISKYIDNLNGETYDPPVAEAWASAVEEIRDSYVGTSLTVPVDLTIRYTARLDSVRYTGMRPGTVWNPGVNQHLIDSGTVSVSNLFFASTWLDSYSPTPDEALDVTGVPYSVLDYLLGIPAQSSYHGAESTGGPREYILKSARARIWTSAPSGAVPTACSDVYADLEARRQTLSDICDMQAPLSELPGAPDTSDGTGVKYVEVPYLPADVGIYGPGSIECELPLKVGNVVYPGAAPKITTGRFVGWASVQADAANPVFSVELVDGREYGSRSLWTAFLYDNLLHYSYDFRGSLANSFAVVKFAKGKMS